MFVGGFFLWNMDNIFCHHLKTARHQIGLPWSVVLEAHGWWHILTGLGTGTSPPLILDFDADSNFRRWYVFFWVL